MAHASTSCPGCEYDLSGETRRWEWRCPVRGLCPECGLEFGWSEALRASNRPVPNFFEHAQGYWPTRKAMVITWLWVACPWVLWNKVGLEQRPSFRRASLWAILLIVPLHATIAVADFVAWSASTSASPLARGALREMVNCLAWPVLEVRTDFSVHLLLLERNHTLLVGVGAMTLAWPLVVMWGFGKSCIRDRRDHVWRVACYSLWPFVVFWALAAVRQLLRVLYLLTTPGGARQGITWEIYDTYKDTLRDALRAPTGVLALASVWLLAWWSITLTRAFRLPWTKVRFLGLWIFTTFFGVVAWIGMNVLRVYL